jgi:hypothetical protein
MEGPKRQVFPSFFSDLLFFFYFFCVTSASLPKLSTVSFFLLFTNSAPENLFVVTLEKEREKTERVVE